MKIKNIQKYQEEPFSDNSVENISIAHLEDCNISRDKKNMTNLVCHDQLRKCINKYINVRVCVYMYICISVKEN